MFLAPATLNFISNTHRDAPSRKLVPLLLSCVLWCGVPGLRSFGQEAPDSTAASQQTDDVATSRVARLLSDACFDCHAGNEVEGNLNLDALLSNFHREATNPTDTQRWWNVLKNIRAGTMPPPDSGYQLASEDQRELSEWIKFEAFGIRADQPDPGRVTLRRLNRREYAATIRELMGIEFEANIAFPPDDTGFGFDNIGDALSLSPLLMEKYLAAAEQIVSQAVPQVTYILSRQTFSGKQFRGEKGAGASLKLHEAQTVGVDFEIEQTTDYRLQLLVEADGTFTFSPQRATVTCALDGRTFHQAEYGWDNSKQHALELHEKLSAGRHNVTVTVEPLPIPEDTAKAERDAAAKLDIVSLSVEGPLARDKWREHPPGYSRFFHRERPPQNAEASREYAREILQRFSRRAFRRPSDSATIERLLGIAMAEWEQGATFEKGIATAMIPVLASPRFLFRMEEPLPTDTDSRFPLIDEFALASRLSYLLWSSMPDEELFALAEQGRLRESLSSQVDRLLADEKFAAFVENFVGQWLRTRDVEQISIDSLAVYGVREQYDELRAEYNALRDRPYGVPQDPRVQELRNQLSELNPYRDVLTNQIRQAMRRETEMLVEYVIREGRDLVEIIDPGYTFLNEHLAKLYGIDGVEGDSMRRVELPENSRRGGILCQGSMLTITSNPTRTSPVKRGLFILENILGTPSPPAPPNVPELEASADRFAGREPSLRELLAVHRESALCASCHSRMDPLGLALENFNALGSWRDEEHGQVIDAEGQLVTGEKFRDVRDLRSIIAKERKADFYRCLTQKTLTYALGRGLEYSDEHTVDIIVEQLMTGDGSFRTLLNGIIHSAAFQRQRRPE